MVMVFFKDRILHKNFMQLLEFEEHKTHSKKNLQPILGRRVHRLKMKWDHRLALQGAALR